MPKTTIFYYTDSSGESPPKGFIESLPLPQKTKIVRILTYIKEYGLVIAIPHVKKLTGKPLWEIRILGKDNIRVLYATVYKDAILILHGFIKKSQKTPSRELETAVSRLNDWLIRTKRA